MDLSLRRRQKEILRQMNMGALSANTAIVENLNDICTAGHLSVDDGYVGTGAAAFAKSQWPV